jgi:hypothetical protein
VAKLGTCCCGGCLMFFDDFDGYLPDLGDAWCEDPSQWKRDSSCAVSESSSAVAICSTKHVVPDGSMNVVMETFDEIDGSGQTYRLMLNVVKTNPLETGVCTSNNFYFADYKRLGASTSTISLGICSGGVETVLKTDTIVGLVDTRRRFGATLSDKEFCAGVSNSVLSFVGTVPPGLFATGHFSGMRFSAADMKAEKFWYYQHNRTNKDCLLCLCKCGTTYIPPRLCVRIYPVTEGCPRLNLMDDCFDFEIEWDRVNSKWVGEWTCCHGGQGWRISFNCPQIVYGVADPTTAVMSIEVGCTGSCGGCGAVGLLPIEATCNPLFWKYGPFNVAGSDLTCFCTSAFPEDPFSRPSCSYYVEVYECP